MDDCFNFGNLKDCAKCKSASYCSKECQKLNWQKHKPSCNFIAEQLSSVEGGELPLDRNLRHWSLRFDATLTSTCIRGLNLKFQWERIGQGGLLVILEPRAHVNVGSRWRIRQAGVFQNGDILDMLDKLGMADQYVEQVLPMHNEARQRVQKSSNGAEDFASVFIVGSNTGKDALEGSHLPVFRFKPIYLNHLMVASMPMAQYAGDWLQDFEDAVEADYPLKHPTPT
ncbi:hypothetical protein C8R47DRAFT_599957 [Mycena vitilis]|nr:hypothetical protein C8R47DRAFT_599957 [Mycena vitilis]